MSVVSGDSFSGNARWCCSVCWLLSVLSCWTAEIVVLDSSWRFSVGFQKIRHSPEPCGYILYHDAMRESGINSLILTDKLLCYYASEFFGEWRSVSGGSSEGDAGWFGRLPSVEFPGQSELVRVAEGMQPVRDALSAIDTNAVFFLFSFLI